MNVDQETYEILSAHQVAIDTLREIVEAQVKATRVVSEALETLNQRLAALESKEK